MAVVFYPFSTKPSSLSVPAPTRFRWSGLDSRPVVLALVAQGGQLVSQFLIVYQRSSGSLIGDVEEFSDDSGVEALHRRAQLEREHGAFSDVEVVVLGARDKSDLIRSHSRYFKSLTELAST